MPNFNKVILAGHLTRDPELRYTPKGTAVLSFSLAVNRKGKCADSGEPRDEVSFIDAEAWGKTAELIERYAKRGTPLLIEGRLKQESWDDKNTGTKRSKIVVVVESLQLLGAAPQTLLDQEPARAVNTSPPVKAPSPLIVARSQTSLKTQPQSQFDDVPF